jgi:hypothetical protein
MAPKMHAGKKQSRRMKGGMTTGEWGIKVFGDSNSQHAVGAGSNVISMRDPNSIAPPQMKGGDWSFEDMKKSIENMLPGSENNGNPDNNGIADAVPSEVNPVDNAVPAAPAMGGKGKRAATKRRKSHKKKGKSSKKRAHKRR